MQTWEKIAISGFFSRNLYFKNSNDFWPLATYKSLIWLHKILMEKKMQIEF